MRADLKPLPSASEVDRRRALERILKVMAPDGLLIVGATEAILSTTDCFTRQEFRGAVYYRLKA
jgi:chemotaxis methyl-accepting protein methylase